MAMTLVEGEGHNGDTYKVIVVADSGNEGRVEIYDSCLKLWSTVRHLPQNLRESRMIQPVRIVIHEDFLYCKARDVNCLRHDIISFNIQNETSIFTSLSLEDVEIHFHVVVVKGCGGCG